MPVWCLWWPGLYSVRTPLPSGATVGCKKGQVSALAFWVKTGVLSLAVKTYIVPSVSSWTRRNLAAANCVPFSFSTLGIKPNQAGQGRKCRVWMSYFTDFGFEISQIIHLFKVRDAKLLKPWVPLVLNPVKIGILFCRIPVTGSIDSQIGSYIPFA